MLYRCVLPFLLLFHLANCQTTDKYTDENRPYKFGFNIQGYQHRQEQKDEKGLIKGEYGFITADGYYRVTVYATDENGDFKILSMKNYYVGFPPEDPTTTPGTTKKLMTTTTPPTTTQKRTILPPYVRPTGVPGCSDCWIPTPDPNDKGKFQGLLPKQVPSSENNSPEPPINKPSGSPQRVQNPSQPVLGIGRNSNFKDLSHPSQEGNKSPRPRIGEVRDGLPPGVTINDIMALLYRFNYTVGFHGHHEQGYRNGDKEGGYFFDGRDGTERQVTYIANEFGYQPNITLIELPQNDVRIPNELTEKQYGLKGYEFKWFYRR